MTLCFRTSNLRLQSLHSHLNSLPSSHEFTLQALQDAREHLLSRVSHTKTLLFFGGKNTCSMDWGLAKKTLRQNISSSSCAKTILLKAQFSLMPFFHQLQLTKIPTTIFWLLSHNLYLHAGLNYSKEQCREAGSKKHCSVAAVPPFLSQDTSIYRDSDDDAFPSHLLPVA